MNPDTILGFARERIAQAVASFSLVGGENVIVQGVFPNYAVTGSVEPDKLQPNVQPPTPALLVIIGDFITVVPGVVNLEFPTQGTPKINGASIFSSPAPHLTRHAGGGIIWLRRGVEVTLDSGTFTTAYNSELDIVSTDISNPDPDTKYSATAFIGAGAFPGDVLKYDIDTISPTSGYVHQPLCYYNNKGEILFRTFGITPGQFDWRLPAPPMIRLSSVTPA